jgi:uncharacterized protein (UPF0264 family)
VTHKTAFSLQRGAAGDPIRLLASIATADEARIAVAAGVDIIDAKDPMRGALGALESATLQAIRAIVPRSVPLSATTGDIDAGETARIVNEIERIAAAGVDVVKIGFFGDVDFSPLLGALGAHTTASYAFGRRVGVIIADQVQDWDFIGQLPSAGFSGVMLDTADKSSGALVDVVPRPRIEGFLRTARRLGLFAGLAGALRLRHIREVKALGPDIVGFRGALCRAQRRTAGIDASAVREVRDALQEALVRDVGTTVLQLPE